MSVRVIYVHNPEDPDAMELAGLEAKQLRDEAAAAGVDDLTVVTVLYVDTPEQTTEHRERVKQARLEGERARGVNDAIVATTPLLEGEVPDE